MRDSSQKLGSSLFVAKGSSLSKAPLSRGHMAGSSSTNPSAFLRNSDDISHALGGNAPFVIDRDNGQITVIGTALPIADYLQRFEADLPLARMYMKPEQPVWT